jgi:hypothetical protein
MLQFLGWEDLSNAYSDLGLYGYEGSLMHVTLRALDEKVYMVEIMLGCSLGRQPGH